MLKRTFRGWRSEVYDGSRTESKIERRVSSSYYSVDSLGSIHPPSINRFRGLPEVSRIKAEKARRLPLGPPLSYANRQPGHGEIKAEGPSVARSPSASPRIDLHAAIICFPSPASISDALRSAAGRNTRNEIRAAYRDPGARPRVGETTWKIVELRRGRITVQK